MSYVVFILSLVIVFLCFCFFGVLSQLKKAIEEIKTVKDANKSLSYMLGVAQDAEKLRNENRKKAQEQMGVLDYDNVDTAISVLHDNAKN